MTPANIAYAIVWTIAVAAWLVAYRRASKGRD